jgi:two-component system, sensor histidine kinase and response regulator
MDRSRNENFASRSKPEGRAATFLARLEQWLFAASPPDSSVARDSMNARPPVRAGLRVLVADDNPGFQNDVRELLAFMGATVLLAADGAQAVALARGNNIDLVLMDLQMPVLDGLGATMQIRQHEREDLSARVAVVAYTSNSADSRLMRDCGVDAVLDKPCTEESLHECVARWCNPRGAEPSGSYRN